MQKQPPGILTGLNTLLLVLIAGCAVAALMETRMLSHSFRNYEAYSSNGQPVPVQPVAQANGLVQPSGALTADEVRQIIRAELATYSDSMSSTERPVQGQAEAPTARAAPQRNEAETSRDVIDVENALANFTYRGRASAAEMANLQAMIARLPPPERDRAMRQLNRAVNSGALEAPL